MNFSLVMVFFAAKNSGKYESGPSEAEERVRSWIYALAQSEKNLTFEYVQSTERGKFCGEKHTMLDIMKKLLPKMI